MQSFSMLADMLAAPEMMVAAAAVPPYFELIDWEDEVDDQGGNDDNFDEEESDLKPGSLRLTAVHEDDEDEEGQRSSTASIGQAAVAPGPSGRKSRVGSNAGAKASAKDEGDDEAPDDGADEENQHGMHDLKQIMNVIRMVRPANINVVLDGPPDMITQSDQEKLASYLAAQIPGSNPNAFHISLAAANNSQVATGEGDTPSAPPSPPTSPRSPMFVQPTARQQSLALRPILSAPTLELPLEPPPPSPPFGPPANDEATINLSSGKSSHQTKLCIELPELNADQLVVFKAWKDVAMADPASVQAMFEAAGVRPSAGQQAFLVSDVEVELPTEEVLEGKRAQNAAINKLEQVFKRIDTDKSGSLSKQELRTGLTLDPSLEEMLGKSAAWDKYVNKMVAGDLDDRISASLDSDGDGEVSLNELRIAFGQALGGNTKTASATVAVLGGSQATPASGSADASDLRQIYGLPADDDDAYDPDNDMDGDGVVGINMRPSSVLADVQTDQGVADVPTISGDPGTVFTELRRIVAAKDSAAIKDIGYDELLAFAEEMAALGNLLKGKAAQAVVQANLNQTTQAKGRKVATADSDEMEDGMDMDAGDEMSLGIISKREPSKPKPKGRNVVTADSDEVEDSMMMDDGADMDVSSYFRPPGFGGPAGGHPMGTAPAKPAGKKDVVTDADEEDDPLAGIDEDDGLGFSLVRGKAPPAKPARRGQEDTDDEDWEPSPFETALFGDEPCMPISDARKQSLIKKQEQMGDETDEYSMQEEEQDFLGSMANFFGVQKMSKALTPSGKRKSACKAVAADTEASEESIGIDVGEEMSFSQVCSPCPGPRGICASQVCLFLANERAAQICGPYFEQAAASAKSGCRKGPYRYQSQAGRRSRIRCEWGRDPRCDDTGKARQQRGQ